MNGTLQLDLSGVGVKLEGLPRGVVSCFEKEWPAFASRIKGRSFIDGRIRIGRHRVESRTLSVKQMKSSFEKDAATFIMKEGRVTVGSDGVAEFELADGADSQLTYVLINLLLATMAWAGPHRGILVVHAAGILIDDRGFILVGREGTGKTTWARQASLGGAAVISDDVVILDLAGNEPMVLGSPFRPFERSCCGSGRWPLVMGLVAKHGPEHLLSDPPRMMLHALMAANLPYVNELAGSHIPLDDTVDRLLKTVPFKTLTFAIDPAFVELLRQGDSRDG